ncbi:MAG TPA: ABC transporter permease subunit [Gemmataceae bacterium]|nr:ABC transporter permease subunit [Gemmataceae bacterium]
MPVAPPPPQRSVVAPSAVRAWCYLVWLCWVRQARMRQMVWIALGLLALTAALIGLNTLGGRWDMGHWRWPWPPKPNPPTLTFEEHLERLAAERKAMPLVPEGGKLEPAERGDRAYYVTPLPPQAALQDGLLNSLRATLNESGFMVFSRWAIFAVFVSFLLPIFSLSFATDAVGGEREGGNLLWLLSRPLPRPAIYFAKFVALLPWSLGLNLAGFGALCLAAGRPGPMAFRLFWPAVFWGTLAFSALFLLLGAYFRRPAVVGLVYAFFLETVFGNLPGYMKRVSISFYVRCMMFDAAGDFGVQPEKPSIYLPVEGDTALWVLLGVTTGLLVLGMWVFSRKEYVEAT